MTKLQMPLLLTPELAEWLEEKVKLGYKKGPLVRHILEEYKKAEQNAKS